MKRCVALQLNPALIRSHVAGHNHLLERAKGEGAPGGGPFGAQPLQHRRPVVQEVQRVGHRHRAHRRELRGDLHADSRSLG